MSCEGTCRLFLQDGESRKVDDAETIADHSLLCSFGVMPRRVGLDWDINWIAQTVTRFCNWRSNQAVREMTY